MSLPYAEADPSTVCLSLRHKTNWLWGNSAPGNAAYFKLSGDEMVPTN